MKITRIGVGDGNDSIVVIRDNGDIPGGRTLDLQGFTEPVRAGHVIIEKADGSFAPLGVESRAYVELEDGERYAGILKKSVTKGNSRAAIMTKGVVNAKALPYEVTDDIVGALDGIFFDGYAGGEGPAPTPPTPTKSPMYLEAAQANSTVSMVSTLATAPNLEYSTDGETWQEWQHTTADGAHTFDIITLGAIGDKVYFRGENEYFSKGGYNFSNFRLGGSISAGGNIMSILDPTMQQKEINSSNNQCFYGLFADNEALTTAADMSSVTNIGDYGCAGMYSGCTSLTTAADMSSVTTIGDNGCNYMYSGCTSLTTAADMSSVTTIGDNGCAGMYSGCWSLTLVSDGQLTFDFATLPFTDGDGNTYNTPQDVAYWMMPPNIVE